MATFSCTQTVSLLWFCRLTDCTVSYCPLLISPGFLSNYGLWIRFNLTRISHSAKPRISPMPVFLHYHIDDRMVLCLSLKESDGWCRDRSVLQTAPPPPPVDRRRSGGSGKEKTGGRGSAQRLWRPSSNWVECLTRLVRGIALFW